MIRYAWLDFKCNFLMDKMKKYSDKKDSILKHVASLIWMGKELI